MTLGFHLLMNNRFHSVVKVDRGSGCDLPSQLNGAYVECFIASHECTAALRIAVEKFSERGYIFREVVQNRVDQLDRSR